MLRLRDMLAVMRLERSIGPLRDPADCFGNYRTMEPSRDCRGEPSSFAETTPATDKPKGLVITVCYETDSTGCIRVVPARDSEKETKPYKE